MADVKDIKFEGSGSHFVTLGRGYRVEKEEVYLYFSGTWLGKSIRFHHKVDRYTYSQFQADKGGSIDVLGEWRYHVIEADYYDEEGKRTASLSGTARQRLNAATNELVALWLTTEDFTQSHARALGYAIQRLGGDRYEPWKQVHGAVSVHHETLSDDVKNALRDWATEIFEAARGSENVTRHLQADKSFNPFFWKTVTREELATS